MSVTLPPDPKPGSAWRRGLRNVAVRYSSRSRARRGELFRQLVATCPTARVLDLGGSNGSYIASLELDAEVFIADVDRKAVEEAATTHGFVPVPVQKDGRLPFPDHYFDVVFCSSVIEHVTVGEASAFSITDKKEFERLARNSQRAFANEVRRLGKHYFVQTPSRYFPIESHTWMPGLIVALPRAAQVSLIRRANRWWLKPSLPDFHLLSARELQSFFPDAHIVRERSFGLTKSLIAVK